MADLSDGQIREKALRDGGFTDEEVSQWKSEAAQKLQDGGFSGQDVRDYFGEKEPDMGPAKKLVEENLKVATTGADGKPKREPMDVSAKPVEANTVWEAMAAGWGNSIMGLVGRGEESPLTMPKDPSAMQTLANAGAQFVGDAPAAIAGMAMGEVAGPVGSMAGAFAVPQGMRKWIVDGYQKGSVQDPADAAQRLVSMTWEATKGALTGAATAMSGGTAGALAGTTAKLGAEIAAQTIVSKGLEGQFPAKNDFYHGAVAIGGLHAVGYIPAKLMNIYAKTGSPPNEVLEAANNDPAFKGELLSANPDLPIEASDFTETKQTPKGEAPIELPSTENLARDEILSRIGEKAEPEKKSLIQRAEDGFSDLQAKHLDYTLVVKDVLAEIGDEPISEKNAHVLMRLHAAVSDKVQDFVEYGTRDWHTGEINGESYSNIIDTVKEMGPEGIKDFNAYRIAARSLELEQRGLTQTGSRETDLEFVESHPEMKPVMDRYVEYRNRVVDYLVGSGRYSEEAGREMKILGESYTPLKKVLEPDPLTGKMAGTAKEIKKIGNSDLQLQDPYISDLQDINMMIRLAHETHAQNTFIQNMREADVPKEFFRFSENQKGVPSKNQIAQYEDGKRALYDVPPEVADSIKRMAGNQPAISTWTSVLKGFATALRVGTVNNPLFAFRHAWRNQLTAPTLSETGLKPFQALLYSPEFIMGKYDIKLGANKEGKITNSYHDFVFDGGAINSIVPLTKGYLDGKIYELNKDAPFLDKAWNTVKTAGAFSHWAIVMNDNMIRFAEYSRKLDRGATRTDAAFAAREVLPDFQKQGLQNAAWKQMTAFLNVHLQGVSRMGQGLKSDFSNAEELIMGKVDTKTGAENLLTGYVAKNIAMFTVPSLLLSAAQAGDDAIDDLPSWQKNNYWTVHVPDWREAHSLAEAMSVKNAYPSNTRQTSDGKWEVNDGTMVRIQKPFTNGILFGSVVEASLNAWQKKDPMAFLEFAKEVATSVVAVPVPTALVPVAEQFANKNFYSGQPIVRQSMENKLPEMQYDRYTSATAKTLGQMLSYVPMVRDIGTKDAKLSSPVVLDNYIHAWGGTLGRYAIDVLDKGLVAAGVQPETVKPTSRLSDIPFAKEFVIRFPSARPQSVSDFEDRYRKADQVHTSVKQLIKDGDVNGATELQNRYAINMDRLTNVESSIKNLNSGINKVYQNPDIKPVEKRQLIDKMMYDITSIAKFGTKLMDEFEKHIGDKR